MLTQEQNDRLTRVGPGTPMGELMRRYWHPIAGGSEVDEENPTKEVRLLGEDLVGRVDLKADRAAGALAVLGAFVEDGCDPARVAGPLARELFSMASWLGLEAVTVAARGDLSPALRRAVDSPL